MNKTHLYIRLLEKKARQNNSQELNVANPSIKPSESNYSRETHTGTTQSHVTNTPPSRTSSLIAISSPRVSSTTAKSKTHVDSPVSIGALVDFSDNDKSCKGSKAERHELDYIIYDKLLDNDAKEDCHSLDDSCNLDLDVIGKILNVNLQEYFSAEVPAQSCFILFDENIRHLNKSQNGRYYKRGHWQHIFSNGLANSNKHCVFIYDTHQISSAKTRKWKKNTPLFKCKGHCKFTDCPMKVYMEMVVQGRVNVYYSGKIKHKFTEQHARPIRLTQREILKESFKDGAKPLKNFLAAFQKKDADQIVSGNCNDIGKDTQVFRQISSESRQIGRKDDHVLHSLLKTMRAEKELGFGFI